MLLAPVHGEQIGVFDRHLDIGLDQPVEGLGGAPRPPQRAAHGDGKLLVGAGHRRIEDILLVAEVPVDAWSGDPRSATDVVNADAAEAVLPKEGNGECEDALARRGPARGAVPTVAMAVSGC